MRVCPVLGLFNIVWDRVGWSWTWLLFLFRLIFAARVDWCDYCHFKFQRLNGGGATTDVVSDTNSNSDTVDSNGTSSDDDSDLDQRIDDFVRRSGNEYLQSDTAGSTDKNNNTSSGRPLCSSWQYLTWSHLSRHHVRVDNVMQRDRHSGGNMTMLLKRWPRQSFHVCR